MYIVVDEEAPHFRYGGESGVAAVSEDTVKTIRFLH